MAIDASEVGAPPSLACGTAADSAGSWMPDFCPKPKLPHVVVHVLLADAQAHLDRADIARLASTIAIGITPSPRCESWITRPGSLMTPPWQLIMLSGVAD